MADRRTLKDGMRFPPTPEEEAFIKGTSVSATTTDTRTSTLSNRATQPATIALSTRIRNDLYAALKRATLERKLNGQTPDSMKEIIEELVEPWLKTNGYLDR